MNERANVREAIIGDRNRRNSIEKKQIEREREDGSGQYWIIAEAPSRLEECQKEREREIKGVFTMMPYAKHTIISN